jgi:hypothetical protein
VALFNAIKNAQKMQDAPAKKGKTGKQFAETCPQVVPFLTCTLCKASKAGLSKDEFLTMLKSGKKDGEAGGPENSQASAQPARQWDVLRDDYMMGASMKDWDQEDDMKEGDLVWDENAAAADQAAAEVQSKAASKQGVKKHAKRKR